MDKFYTALSSLFRRSFKQWAIIDSTLAYFVATGTLKGCKEVHIAVTGDTEAYHFMQQLHEFIANEQVIVHHVDDMRTPIEEMPVDWDRDTLKFPANLGEVLDNYSPHWGGKYKRTREYPKNCFFDEERRKGGHEFIAKMLECGDKVGIVDKMFLGFGNVLGYALYGDFLPNDNDIDMCFLDGIPQEQRQAYLDECKDAGLTENRECGPTTVEGKYSWFSSGPKSPMIEHGVKSCKWFWFEHGGYYWHSKGTNWIGHRGLNKEFPTAKGIPTTIFNGELKKVQFGDVAVQIPKNIGQCLDWWYPGWLIRKKEQSAEKAILVMPKEERRYWYIEVRE
jgi:hypothetical protein